MTKHYTLLLVLLAGALGLSAQALPRVFNLSPKSLDTENGGFVTEATLSVAPATFDFSQPLHLDLGRGVAYDVTLYKRPPVHAAGEVDVYYGNSGDARFGHLEDYTDIILVVNRATNRLRVDAMTADGLFTVSPRGKTYQLERHDATNAKALTPSGELRCEDVPAFSQLPGVAKSQLATPCGETDAQGRHVIDMLFTYSLDAATAEADIMTHAIAQAETANVGLTNSLVDNLVMRVIDVVVGDNAFGVDVTTLENAWNFYENDRHVVAADMLADYQDAVEGADNNYGGWGSTGGQRSINAITGPTVFRHEFGHNLGSSHCSGGIRTYAAGYDNGVAGEKTHMCGNQLNFFSNPDLDVSGTPIGDAATADNARLAREVALLKSSYERHVIPYAAGDNGVCAPEIADGYYTLQNVATGGYLSPIGSGGTGDKLEQQSTTTTGLQVWSVHNTGNGHVMIHNASTGRAVDFFSTGLGPNVGLWTSAGGNRKQMLYVSPTAGGNFTIQSVISGYYLRPDAATDGDGATVNQETPTGTDLDEWVFAPAPASLAPASAPVSITNSQTPVSCVGQTTGTATVAATGGNGSYAYEWPDGQTTATATGLSSGSYTVTVTSGGRQYTQYAHVMTTAPLVVSGTVTNVYPESKGAIEITGVNNASGALTYAWSDGGPATATRTGLDAGNYTVTVTDANGCTDERIFKIGRAYNPATEYLIQDVVTGEYLGPTVPGGYWANLVPFRFSDCPTAEFAFQFEQAFGHGGNTFVKNVLSGNYWRLEDDGDVVEWTRQGLRSQYFRTEFLDDDLVTFRNIPADQCVTAAVADASSLSGTACGGAAQTFRLVPVPACATAGDACTDNNNSTDDDEINLLCDCCGEKNDCFGVAGAAPNGDGDVDGDGVCVEEDCDDTDATNYPGALCDDGAADNFGDAVGTDCVCLGRPESCTETGDDLDVVSYEATASVRNALGSSAPASVLNDGIINGVYNEGNVWHSGQNYSYADLDLNTVQSVRELRVYPRTDCCLDRLNGVYVFLSDQPFPGVSVGDAQSVATYEYIIPNNWDSADPVIIQPNVTARYVRIKQPNNRPLNLTEIEVRSCPQATVLPVDLLSFTGRTAGKTNELVWTTAGEEAFSHYTVERSNDGSGNWVSLGEVAGTGAATYRFTDAAPPARAAYRLRMTDQDGTEARSDVIWLTHAPAGWRVFPVPANESVTVSGLARGTTTLDLYSATGQRLGRTAVAAGVTSVTVDLRGLAAGVYLLRGDDGGVRRIIVR